MRAVLTLHHPRLAERYYDSGQWRDETFYTLLAKRAKEQPDAIALVSKSGKMTWTELLHKVDLAAGAFVQKGLQPGDRVSLWMSDRAEVVIAFLACSRAGLACNPSLHRTYTVAEVAELLSRIEASVLIAEDGWGADHDKVNLVDAVADRAGHAVVWTPEQLYANGVAAQTKAANDPDSLAYLAFTSGTTGAPKCVMHSANTLLSNACDLVSAWSLNADARLLCLSPLSHHIGWVAVGQWLVSGCRLILGTPPVGQTLVDWIVETEATYVMGVPTHAMDILAAQRSIGLPRLGSVQAFYMAGAPIPEVVAEAFIAQGIKPQNVYGMTENSSHQFTHPDDDPEIWTGTCGRGGPGYEVAIFNAEDADQPAAPGEVGQIAGRGANLMLGYFDNQTDTAKSFNRDGWFLSGDL
ncbi:MAG: long-chain fatty acid--CoA ligase, partial [Pseudomonadota bacterium]